MVEALGAKALWSKGILLGDKGILPSMQSLTPSKIELLV